jgi:hypothetical protein
MLDRCKVSEVVCALCDLRQPVSKECAGCGVQFGRYACLVCNFFDDDTKKLQFHCEDCGEQLDCWSCDIQAGVCCPELHRLACVATCRDAVH